jgi:pantoate--beta-alanine ligase
MKTFETVKDLQSVLRPLRMKGMSIGFVPTMGALHDGHLSLARTLKDHCDVRVCSIFVNPTQFNDPKDYEAYTVNLEQDKKLLEGEGVDILFAPRVEVVVASVAVGIDRRGHQFAFLGFAAFHSLCIGFPLSAGRFWDIRHRPAS